MSSNSVGVFTVIKGSFFITQGQEITPNTSGNIREIMHGGNATSHSCISNISIPDDNSMNAASIQPRLSLYYWTVNLITGDGIFNLSS